MVLVGTKVFSPILPVSEGVGSSIFIDLSGLHELLSDGSRRVRTIISIDRKGIYLPLGTDSDVRDGVKVNSLPLVQGLEVDNFLRTRRTV